VTWLAVAAGGAAGAVCRYVIDFVVTQRLAGVFPWGTWVVNITGSLLLGFIAGITVHAGQAALWQVAAGAGFCGAYTTFSTFMYETLQLVERRAWWETMWNLASLLVGVAAAAAGWLLSTGHVV
jgi:CrcB protein